MFSYIDDCCLAGEQVALATALHDLKQQAEAMGLKLNESKCEIIPVAGTNSTLDDSLSPPLTPVRREGNFELLGAAVGSRDFCNQHTQERVDKACKVLDAIGELPDPQVALLLLRHCCSFGKLVYSLRLTPHDAHDAALHNFDQAVRDCFEHFLALHLTSYLGPGPRFPDPAQIPGPGSRFAPN